MKSLMPVRCGALGPRAKPRRLAVILLASLLALVAFVTPVVADNSDTDDMASGGLSAEVQRYAFA